MLNLIHTKIKQLEFYSLVDTGATNTLILESVFVQTFGDNFQRESIVMTTASGSIQDNVIGKSNIYLQIKDIDMRLYLITTKHISVKKNVRTNVFSIYFIYDGYIIS